VQLLWEENMAEQIAGYLASSRGEGKIMVVIAGGAHVQHGYGVPKRVLRRLPAPYYIVLPAVISAPAPEDVPEGERIYMDVDLPEIPLLSADFIWAVPYEFIGKRKVLMGIRLNFDEGTGTIEQVAEDSPAMEAGVRVGDVLVGLDDVEIRDMEDVTIVMRSKTVGDSIDIRVLRDGSETTFRARFTEPASSSG
jgi:membrane-associated protease RseP (regulator of RpoE activity)